ncbi:MAG: hypothetical protein RW306_20110, partial [Geobacteraceae bacterium]|nr:hypothetical protein [Geobacteraceae bacterium]
VHPDQDSAYPVPRSTGEDWHVITVCYILQDCRMGVTCCRKLVLIAAGLSSKQSGSKSGPATF